jgi:Co/Zn/Cd efflux system component
MILYGSEVQNGEYGFCHCIRRVQDRHHLGLHTVTEAENKSLLKSVSCQALDFTVCILHKICENLIHHGKLNGITAQINFCNQPHQFNALITCRMPQWQ